MTKMDTEVNQNTSKDDDSSKKVQPSDENESEIVCKDKLEWLLANDSQINTSTYEGLISNLDLFKDDTPYVLFYRRLVSSEKPHEEESIDNVNISNRNLLNFIEQDNKMYTTEERTRIVNLINERKLKSKAKQTSNGSSAHNKFSYSSKEDDDDSSSSGGGGNGQPDNYCSSDSQRESGPRIIF
jgi:hypothetical protein